MNNSRIETYSTFTGLAIPVLSALTFSSDGSAKMNVSRMDYLPTVIPSTQVEFSPNPYSEQLDSRSSQTMVINSDVIDLMAVKSFAEHYIKNLTPIEESIQAVIDDYFWEML